MFRCVATFAVAAALALPAAAQFAVQRAFPQTALRGELTITAAPNAVLNKRPARLAPGVRIRATNNMMVVTGEVIGRTFTVNYTAEPSGLILDVWILRPDEIKVPWPRTREEAAKLDFDAAAQRWTPRRS